jgi:hypothetical protein
VLDEPLKDLDGLLQDICFGRIITAMTTANITCKRKIENGISECFKKQKWVGYGFRTMGNEETWQWHINYLNVANGYK